MGVERSAAYEKHSKLWEIQIYYNLSNFSNPDKSIEKYLQYQYL